MNVLLLNKQRAVLSNSKKKGITYGNRDEVVKQRP